MLFWLWYGFVPLNIEEDKWLFYGYAESDNMQHYTGWLAFRNSQWAFPLGKITTIAHPQGTQISFMDSIPWLAVFLKLFNPILPETFQYFGIYILVCFILQFYAVLLIFTLYSKNILRICINSIFFLFVPIIIERAFRHSSLTSHWLILFGIYLFLRAKKISHSRKDYIYILLIFLSVGIHPYFLPMVFGMTVADAVDIYCFDKNKKKAIMLVLLSCVAIVISSIILGIFKLGGSTVNLFQGYGYFSANLNCFFNPVSTNIMKTGVDAEAYHWSAILPILPQTLGNYDGFNYLGIGGIFLLTYDILWLIWSFLFNRKGLVNLGKKYIFLILIMLFYATYAITNTITLNELQVEIWIPDWIENICGIFAASGRFMYPVHYIILIFGFIQLSKIRLKDGIKNCIFVTILLLQVWDLHDMIALKHSYFENFQYTLHTNSPYEAEYDTPFWSSVAQNYNNVWIVDSYRSIGYGLAEFCAKNNLKTNYIVSNRFSTEELEHASDFEAKLIEDLKSGNLESDSVYIITDILLADELKNNLASNARLSYDNYYYGEFLIILPD